MRIASITTLLLQNEPQGFTLSYFYRALVLTFLSNIYISPWLGDIFKFLRFRLLKNAKCILLVRKLQNFPPSCYHKHSPPDAAIFYDLFSLWHSFNFYLCLHAICLRLLLKYTEIANLFCLLPYWQKLEIYWVFLDTW